MRQFLARIFLFTGFLCFVLLSMLVYQRYRPNSLAFQGAVFTRELSATYDAYPESLSIPNAEVHLPIFPSVVSGNSWQTTERGVSYLKSTPIPGHKGNAVLYGHNWPNLLGPLHSVKVGDTIIVNYPEEKKLHFKVAYITVVTPEQVKILDNSDDVRLTIYTCTGFLDSKRLVITAVLSEV